MNNRDRTTMSGQIGKDSQDRTAGEVQPGQVSLDTGQVRLERPGLDGTQRIVWSEHDSKVGQLRRKNRDMKP